MTVQAIWAQFEFERKSSLSSIAWKYLLDKAMHGFGTKFGLESTSRTSWWSSRYPFGKNEDFLEDKWKVLEA